MAQDRMEESSAAVKALYGTENPCNIKGAPELGEIMQKFIYSDVNNQVKMPLAQKELLTLVVLTANNTPEDIGIHVKGALNAGAQLPTPTALPKANKRRLTSSATVCAVLQIPAKATRRILTTGSAATASAITTPAKCLI